MPKTKKTKKIVDIEEAEMFHLADYMREEARELFLAKSRKKNRRIQKKMGGHGEGEVAEIPAGPPLTGLLRYL